jgi:cytochrome P450
MIISYIFFKFLLYYKIKNFHINIPGPKPWIIIGNTYPLIFNSVHKVIHNWIENYGDIFIVWLGITPFIIVNNLNYIKKILLSRNGEYKKGIFADIMKPLLGQGLLTSEDQVWKEHHKLAISIFQPLRYKDSISGMLENIKKLINKWDIYEKESKIFDLYNEFSRLTLDNIGTVVFGEDFGAIMNDNACIFHEVEIILKEMQKRAEQIYPIYKYYPNFMNKLFNNSNNKIHQIVKEKIEKRKFYLRNSKKFLDNSKKCLLDVLLESQMISNNLTNSEIEDEMITWVMGGHETTSSLLSWICYLLDQYPEIQNKIIQEIKKFSILENSSYLDNFIVPSFEILQKMDYLTMVIKEALRLFPPAPLLNRVVAIEHNLGPYKLSKGIQIIISPWSLHRSKQYWGNDVNEFKPERFQNNDYNNFYAYLPFGAGPRACLGKTFAFLEVKLILFCLLQRFQIHIYNKNKIDTEIAITLRAKPYIHSTLSLRK